MQYENFTQAIKSDFNIDLDHNQTRRGIAPGPNKNQHLAICVKTEITTQIKQQWFSDNNNTYNSIIPLSKLENSLESALAGTHIYSAQNLTFTETKLLSVKSKTPYSYIKIPHTIKKVKPGVIYSGYYKLVDFIELSDNTVHLIWKKEK